MHEYWPTIGEESNDDAPLKELRVIKDDQGDQVFAEYLGTYTAYQLEQYVNPVTRQSSVFPLQAAQVMLGEICADKDAGQIYISSLFKVISDWTLLEIEDDPFARSFFQGYNQCLKED